MAYREVTMLEVKEVLRLWLTGLGKKRIAKLVGLDPKTIRRYVDAAHGVGLRLQQGTDALTDDVVAAVLAALRSEGGRPHGDSWARCAAERDFIRSKLDKRVLLSKVQRLLRRRGVVIPYATLHRFAVAELGFGRGRLTIPVADCGPGEEVQVDTGWTGRLEPDERGKRRRFRSWIFTSVYSRHRFVYPCFQESTATAIQACEAAWDFFGGIFRVMIPDNTKAIVQLADPLEPLLNPTFLEYAQARGFPIDPTRVRHPRDKARVERSVQTVRDDCFGGETLRTIEEARARALTWCRSEYGMRRHTRTLRLPLEHFEADEKPRLLAPPLAPYDPPLWCDPKVARDQHAAVAKALYSLPSTFVGKRLRARADQVTVRFYQNGVLVKAHPRKPPGGKSTDPHDFPAEKTPYALRDVAFLQAQADKHGESVGIFARALLEGPLPWTKMRSVYALLALAKKYGSVRLDAACAKALDADMSSVPRLKRMLELDWPAESPSHTTHIIPLARYLRPASQYSLPFASRTEGEKDDD